MNYQYQERDSDRIRILIPSAPLAGILLLTFSVLIVLGLYFLGISSEDGGGKFWLPIVFSVVIFLAGITAFRTYEIRASREDRLVSIACKILGIPFHGLTVPFDDIDEILYRTKRESMSHEGEATNGFLSLISSGAYHKIPCPDEAGLMGYDQTEYGVLGLSNKFKKLQGLQLGLELACMTTKPFTLVADRYEDDKQATIQIRELIQTNKHPEEVIKKVQALFDQVAFQIREEWE